MATSRSLLNFNHLIRKLGRGLQGWFENCPPGGPPLGWRPLSCNLILDHTHWQIRLLSKSNLLHRLIADKMIPERHHQRIIFGFSSGTLDDPVAKAIETGTPLVSQRLSCWKGIVAETPPSELTGRQVSKLTRQHVGDAVVDEKPARESVKSRRSHAQAALQRLELSVQNLSLSEKIKTLLRRIETLIEESK